MLFRSASRLEAALRSLYGTDVSVLEQPGRRFTILIQNGENVGPLALAEADSLQRSVKEALQSRLGLTIDGPEALRGYAVTITEGAAKNKVRLITGGRDPDASPASGRTVLELARPWTSGLDASVPSAASDSAFTIDAVNGNLLADEAEEIDRLVLDEIGRAHV